MATPAEIHLPRQRVVHQFENGRCTGCGLALVDLTVPAGYCPLTLHR